MREPIAAAALSGGRLCLSGARLLASLCVIASLAAPVASRADADADKAARIERIQKQQMEQARALNETRHVEYEALFPPLPARAAPRLATPYEEQIGESLSQRQDRYSLEAYAFLVSVSRNFLASCDLPPLPAYRELDPHLNRLMRIGEEAGVTIFAELLGQVDVIRSYGQDPNRGFVVQVAAHAGQAFAKAQGCGDSAAAYSLVLDVIESLRHAPGYLTGEVTPFRVECIWMSKHKSEAYCACAEGHLERTEPRTAYLPFPVKQLNSSSDPLGLEVEAACTG